jgi:DNA-directed RNA polymerase specialized sigma24 family protein
LERLCQLRDDSVVIAWVNMIALNTYRRVLGREHLMLPLQNLSSRCSMDVAETDPNAIDLSAIDLSAIDLNKALSACRPCERALLEKHMGGVTTREIASDEGVSETAIRIRLHRARRSARLHLLART